jgi:uncharacterized RDD family membrane protein YckC
VTCGTDLRKYTPPVSQSGTQTRQSVAPDVKYAGFWLRFVAFFIDILLFCILFFPIIPYMMIVVNPTDTILLTVILTAPILFIVLYWIYSSLMEASKKQATLGKLVFGIIVTDDISERITLSRATGRYFAKILSFYILCIGHIMIAFTQKKQGLHDLLASTLVIKK